MCELSLNTLNILKNFYESEDLNFVTLRLLNECSTTVLGCDEWSPIQMERIWFTILKLGFKDRDRLDYAIQLAKTDLRDLLVTAGFSEDLNSHETWRQSIKC